MSTHARIIIKDGDIYKSIYLHNWDNMTHRTLCVHYKTKKKMKQLIELGDISLFGKSIDKTDGHSFDTPIKDCTVFYHRDRGEKWEHVRTNEDIAFSHIDFEQFNYFYNGEFWEAFNSCGESLYIEYPNAEEQKNAN